MQFRLIRSATLRLTYGGREILTDPFFAPKHSMRSFAGISRNPIVDLPVSPEEAVSGAELVIVSHLHSDHFDDSAKEILPKGIPIFCQPGDEVQLREKGFEDVSAIEDSVDWQGISITITTGRHGSGEVAEKMGKVSGFIFRTDKEPTVYWLGDTILYEEVQDIIAQVQPDIIISHSSGAKFGDSDPIVTDAEQTVAICKLAPQATVIAVHMESLDHGTISRQNLRQLADDSGLRPEQLLIPADGQTLSFPAKTT
jgi:L-ascorbate metabolism protein UlaG (beta-lactamase superfamily)